MPQAWDNIDKSYKVKIAIAFPYNSNFSPEWMTTTYLHLKYIPIANIVKFPFESKLGSLPASRDALVTMALKSNTDYIFFVDTDLIFEQPQDPNLALNQLYQIINKDPNSKEGKIVTGLYRARKKEGFDYAAWFCAKDITKQDVKGYIAMRNWTGNYIKIDVSGLGCCLIDTKIFNEIEKPWFRWDDHTEISEDFYFFELAKKHGYDLHLFTDVRLSHLGTFKLKSDGTFSMPEM